MAEALLRTATRWPNKISGFGISRPTEEGPTANICCGARSRVTSIRRRLSDPYDGGDSPVFDQLPNGVWIVKVSTRIAPLIHSPAIVGPRRGDVRLVALTGIAPAVVIGYPKYDKMLQLSLTGRGLLRYAQPIWKCIDHNQSLVGEGVCLCPVSA